MAVTIEGFAHPDALDPADQEALVAIYNACWSEWNPRHVPWSREAGLARSRLSPPPHVIQYHLARTAGGEVVGTAELHWRDGEDGSAGLGRIFVHPGHRRQGVATGLYERCVAAARAAGLVGITLEAVEGHADLEPVLERHRFTRDLLLEQNLTEVDRIDEALLRAWAAAGEALEGYSLVTYDAPAPEDLAAPFVEARHVLNTAPLREGEPEAHYTVEELRAAEACIESGHQDWWAVGVRHEASGAIVGLSEMYLPRLEPHLAIQGDTGVHPEHRGHGLGAWMKAVNHLRLAAERPEVRLVQTWNASSNEPMLRINRALGFQPVQRYRSWYKAFARPSGPGAAAG